MQFGINLKRLPRKLQICLSDVPRAINGCLVTHPGIWIGMISNNVKYFLRNGNIRSSIKRIKGFRKWDTYLTIFSMHSMQKFLLYHYCYVLYCVFCRQVGNISLSNSWKKKAMPEFSTAGKQDMCDNCPFSHSDRNAPYTSWNAASFTFWISEYKLIFVLCKQ